MVKTQHISSQGETIPRSKGISWTLCHPLYIYHTHELIHRIPGMVSHLYINKSLFLPLSPNLQQQDKNNSEQTEVTGLSFSMFQGEPAVQA